MFALLFFTGLAHKDRINWLVYDNSNTDSCSIRSHSTHTSEIASLLRYTYTHYTVTVDLIGSRVCLCIYTTILVGC